MSEKVLQQDLSQKEPDGNVFVIHLLMQDKCPVPEKQDVISIMEKHLGEIDCYSYSEESIGFDVKKYPLDFDGKTAYPMLMLTNCFLNEKLSCDELTRSQMWDCPESDEIIARCHYDVVTVDMLSAYMDYKDRADMLMDFTEALMELYPTCEAVYFYRSGKMFTRQAILEHSIPRKDRFIYFAVNVRFFNIEGSGDMLIDSLGMSELNLPDLTSKLSIRSCKGLGREYQEWNSLVEEYKKNYSLILEEKWKPKLTTLDLDVKEVTGDISFNILTLVMADAYREIEPVSDFFVQLLEIYKEGFLPCGWKGKKYDGSFIVY